MSLFSALDVGGMALQAQSIRLNTISSNLANADVVSGSADSVYRARYPVFETVYGGLLRGGGGDAAGVQVSGIRESGAAARREYEPTHPLADEQGYIYRSNVNTVEQMAGMISASRAYQTSVEAMNTTKQLIMRTLTLGR